MRDPQRISEILELVNQIWQTQPDMRFLQLIYVLQAKYSQRNQDVGKVVFKEEDGYEQIGFKLHGVEDDKFIDYLKEIIEKGSF